MKKEYEFSNAPLHKAILAAEGINSVNKAINPEDKTNAQWCSALDTVETDVSVWWNKLSWGDRVDVIGLAVHYNQTSPNSRWNMDLNFNDYTKQKQRIIKSMFSKRNKTYLPFDLASMVGL